MKFSPLQLDFYFVAESHVTTNRQFNQTEPLQLRGEDIDINPEVRNVGEGRKWQITLKLVYNPGPERNAPYSFSLEIVGFFSVAAKYPEEKIEKLVQTNGSTILYGIVREMVRDFTASGPYPPFIIPSASFLEDSPKNKTPLQEEHPVGELPSGREVQAADGN